MDSPAGGGAALAALRVLDLSRMLAGPFCTALLADVGAEVIKVETPGVGDDARQFAPRRGGESAYFMILNRGKKSITLNLKSPRGAALVRALAARCDVLVENFKPGVTKRLGLDYEALRVVTPRLVYASISGFGQVGPLAHRPAYDIIAQAMGGLMSITGTPEGEPTRVGESMGALCAGLYAAWGILVALMARQRTGQGQHVDVAMLDSVFSLLVTALSLYLYEGKHPGRIGNRHPMSTPFDSYRARDGHVIIAVANDHLFRRLAATMGRPGLADDPRFATDEQRTRHEAALRAEIEAWAAGRTVEGIVATLEAASVPASPIWTVEQVANSDHIKFREMLVQVEHARAGLITLVQEPVQFSGTPRQVQGPPPLLGEDTEAVLSTLLGLDGPGLDTLRRDGVI